jgi:hypothetical protein
MVCDDIEKAKQIIKDNNREVTLFDEFSFIFKITNENMNDENYFRLLCDNKKLLSVIGSGDQILNSILLGSKDIDAFDISRFPKYFLELKMAAVKCLSYEEYINFFYDGKSFNRRTLKRVLCYASKDVRDFWEGICDTSLVSFNFDKLSPRAVYNSTLFSKNAYMGSEREIAIKYNPYLDKSNYDQLKRRIEEINITYLTGNIMHLDYVRDRTYDLVNLSNICMYQDNLEGGYYINERSRFKDFITNLRLGDNGKVINYLFDYYPLSMSYRLVLNKYLNDPNFSVQKVNSSDALLVYKKKR